ncbi:GMC family oxidoreductase N-terminal domain-containing protein [Nocardia sp. R6R-6]|uniref:GMC family oxidoreductase N-terminal domain-containing protein n=1 Tax=Nocardia sp. R6R-6 TaxID=3459303 RepID=UPI00403E2BBD
MARYEYIVIGAGSAGCAVAARLAAAEPARSVLLIEAGGSDMRLSTQAPLAYAAQFGGATDWGFHSEPEPNCADRVIAQPRGKVLGGTSAMNAMVWVRGARSDYDGWQLPDWAWDDVAPVFRRIESHYLRGENHGDCGPMRITQSAEPDETSVRFVAAARAAGVPANDDVGGPDLEGAALSPVTVWKGRRFSAARAYLTPARRRKNLTVITRALVHRVLISESRAVGVEYEHRGRPQVVHADGEIIISAGAFGTPQLLQLSGIGPADRLRAVGITPLVDSPRVGHGLADHPSTFMSWDLQPGFTGLADATHPKWLIQWLIRRTGKLASNLIEAIAHIRTTPDLTDPDFQLIFAPVYASGLGDSAQRGPAFTIAQSLWTPASRGSVLVRSPDPRSAPAIQLNTFDRRADIDAFIRAVRRTREIVATEPLASVAAAEINPGPHVVTDRDLEQWIRGNVSVTGHPACTAAMGSDTGSVLDEHLRVRGVAGLRVADASALPDIPRANTNAPAIMIGERCAEFICRDRADLRSRGVPP